MPVTWRYSAAFHAAVIVARVNRDDRWGVSEPSGTGEGIGMGVSVRLSRNARVYLPFWIAIPAYLILGVVWLAIAAGWVLAWLIITGCKLVAGRSGTRRRVQARGQHRPAREAQRPEAITTEQALVEQYQRQREEAQRKRQDAIEAELEQYRRQVQDHAARTHRYRVTECNIDALKGGEFTVEAEGLDPVQITLDTKSVIDFLPVKAGDIVEVTLAPGNAGVEEFWQICRANGTKPRSPVKWSGFAANRSKSGG